LIAQARSVQPGGPGTGLSDKSTKDYAVYKTYLLFFGLIDAIYKYFFKVSFQTELSQLIKKKLSDLQ